MIFDLIVVGNGLAAQAFLKEFLNEKKSQNFLVAQVYSEVIAPACSNHSTASVSLNGVEEGVSDLGDTLRAGFFSFKEFFETNRPPGIIEVEQLISHTTDIYKGKLIRRYKQISDFHHPYLKIPETSGVKLKSYLVSPDIFLTYMQKEITHPKITKIEKFVKKVEKKNGVIECTLEDNSVIKSKKILLCTGAYARIYCDFFPETPKLFATQVVAGSFLSRTIDLKCDSFYMTIDGHNLQYRSIDHNLLIGSASIYGNVGVPDYKKLNEIFDFFKEIINLPLGSFDDYDIQNGVRHKGIRRRPMIGALDDEKLVFINSALYKNGYSLPFYAAKKLMQEIF